VIILETLIQRLRSVDTKSVEACTPGDKSGIKRKQPITREQGIATGRFVQLASEICLTQPIHPIAANKKSGRQKSARFRVPPSWLDVANLFLF
jgi:hypothetical protein